MDIKVNSGQRVLVTSDLHIGHNNVIKYSNRPFSDAKEMDAALIENWNRVVNYGDIVINVGDFAFSNERRVIEVLSQLNGQQHFVYGNHDRVMKRPKVQEYCKQTKKILTFSDTLEFKYKGTFVFVSHYAHRVWNRHHYGSVHLYGHSHGTLPSMGRSMDVGVDSTEMGTQYEPLELDKVIAHLKQKDIGFHSARD